MTPRRRTIVTHFEYPPIPMRDHDWVAYWDGDEELGQYGYGRTDQEAINALLDEYPRCKSVCDYVGFGGECLLCGAENGEVCRTQREASSDKE